MSVFEPIVDAWFLKAIGIYPEPTRRRMLQPGDRFGNPVAFSLRQSLAALVAELAGDMNPRAVSSALDAIVRVRAVQDCAPEDAVGFAGYLRDCIRASKADGLFPDIDRRIGSLADAARRQYALCKQDLGRVRCREASRLRALQPWMRQAL
jgi:hypothetical protein